MRPTSMIGIDIGGSHISSALINEHDRLGNALRIQRCEFDAKGSSHSIVNAVGKSLEKSMPVAGDVEIIGIAVPGPFDYENGVSRIAGVGGKFESIFGLHLREAVKEAAGIQQRKVHFFNDAHCFAIGAYARKRLQSKKTIFLTLGTGFGSAFMQDGHLVKLVDEQTGIAAFFDCDFLDAKADDYFSSRWFLNEYNKRTGATVSSVKELAAQSTDIANSIFEEFGSNLGIFLFPFLQRFSCNELVIGGNIAKAFSLFENPLREQLKQTTTTLEIVCCTDTEECVITGAALLANEKSGQANTQLTAKNKRKSIQPLLPVEMTPPTDGEYNVFPFIATGKDICKGYEQLAEKIEDSKILILDGYVGVFWEETRRQLQKHFSRKNKKVFWYDVSTCLKTAPEMDELVKENLNGDDPLFGKKYKGALEDLFDRGKLELLKPDTSADICILYGTGAALANWKGTLVYLDIPKNEIQYRMRAGSISNIGTSDSNSLTGMYKRFYFVDWPVLNKHKEEIVGKIDYIVDAQRLDEITWMEGNDFRNALEEIFAQPFRARPWFEAGVWGGHWMKNNFRGLNDREVNYAWSFELITPENGIVLEGEGYLLEVSFDFLLFYNNKKLLGKAASRFGKEFPIRFNFLDTYVGGNLSIQCHPRTDYIRERFGENFTQDETYYILDCEPGAKVYLGFQEDIDPAIFKTALLDAQQNGTELPVEKFVQIKAANQHDLFLVPNGTIHASGKNNLVLEISSTPYIFTFKMYDWLRLDLNGQPRPINIEHAFNNLYFDRKGDYVKDYLISKPAVVEEWSNGRKINLPTHAEHFYAINRYEFTGEVTIETAGQCHICMLVEGNQVEVLTNSKTTLFNYAETFVIPAAIERYSVVNKGSERLFLIVAFVKDSAC